MGEYAATRKRDRCPSHPGVLLHDVLENIDLTKQEVARRLAISRQQLHDIMTARKPVSPAVAVKIGALLGNGGGLWLRMQAAYDLWHAEQEIDTSQIEPIGAE